MVNGKEIATKQYITAMPEGGIASKHGGLSVNDDIVEVNGQTLLPGDDMHDEVVKCLTHHRIEFSETVGGRAVVAFVPATQGSIGIHIADDHDGIFIEKIASGSAAEVEGTAKKGMRIVSANGVGLTGSDKHDAAVHALTHVRLMVVAGTSARPLSFNMDQDWDSDFDLGGPVSSLVGAVSSDALSVEERAIVESQMQPSQQLPPTDEYDSMPSSNISITAGVMWDPISKTNNVSLGISHCSVPGRKGIYINKVMDGSAAALDGRLKPGDLILKVNDVDISNASHEEAKRALSSDAGGQFNLVIKSKPREPPLTTPANALTEYLI
jgi:C-terminal processing protease CtpA/Prc